jgi:hypothetical protein
MSRASFIFYCHLESAGGIDRGHGLWTLNREHAQGTLACCPEGFRQNTQGIRFPLVFSVIATRRSILQDLRACQTLRPIEITSPVAAIAAMRGN